MSPSIEWPEIVFRLLLAAVAGAILGFDRSERGRPAGLRTTMLVCLAAAVSMLQTNLLLPMHGKTPESFAVMDLMRLPLGVLTGMGFIGAGAIIRKGNHTEGVTTAATLWSVTLIGLCIGGGQWGLGLAATALSLFVIEGLRWLDRLLKPGREATLQIVIAVDGPTDRDFRGYLNDGGYSILSNSVCLKRLKSQQERTIVRWRLRSRSADQANTAPSFVDSIAKTPVVLGVHWRAD
jgi:putative Mg2+ transporter-C (MgtC) family protein